MFLVHHHDFCFSFLSLAQLIEGEKKRSNKNKQRSSCLNTSTTIHLHFILHFIYTNIEFSKKLLTTLRLLQDPSANSKLGIPALDRLLATNTPRFDPTNLSSVPAPPIIEITSPVPKYGKTELLYWIIAQLVLGDLTDHDEQYHASAEDSTKDDTTGTRSQERIEQMETLENQTSNDETGPEATVLQDEQSEPLKDPQPNPGPNTQQAAQSTAIALLATSPISILRLSQITLHRIQQLHPSITLTKAQELTHTALSHIHIFQPQSLQSLISTISTLPSYFLNPSNKSFDRKLAIVLDSASAYFWEDKHSIGERQGQGNVGKYPALAAVLKRISGTLQAPIFFSTENISATTSIASNSGRAETMALRPSLPPPWSTLPSLRLIIQKPEIAGFGKDIDAKMAIRENKNRQGRIREVGLKVSVNQYGNEGWMSTSHPCQSFTLNITNHGVEIG